MGLLKWDQPGERSFETGVKKAVLYVQDSSTENDSGYGTGVAWNGLTAVTESPSGAEPTPLYANDSKYLNLLSAEEFAATIEAYTYPDAFAECDGSANLVTGAQIGQQARKTFGLCYRTTIGNDSNPEAGYKIHIIYGCLAAPSEKAYASINDSPEAITFSWEVSTTPVPVNGHKPTATIVIDSTKFTEELAPKLAALEKALYGSDAGPEGSPAATVAYLPTPDEIYTMLS